MSPFLVFLLTFFSMHACNARFVGLIHKEESGKQDFVTMDVEKVNLREISIPSKAPEREEVGNTRKSSLGATNIINRKNLQANLKEKEAGTKKDHSGNKLIVSSQRDLPQTTKIEGLKRKERSVLGSAPTGTEEAVESNEKDITEDVVEMDYAQPHRKPPIHNEKP